MFCIVSCCSSLDSGIPNLHLPWNKTGKHKKNATTTRICKSLCRNLLFFVVFLFLVLVFVCLFSLYIICIFPRKNADVGFPNLQMRTQKNTKRSGANYSFMFVFVFSFCVLCCCLFVLIFVSLS